MTEKEKYKGDFFSDLMFGRSPTDSQETTPSKQTEYEQKENETDVQPNQLDQILTLVQTIGPTLEKLAPLLGIVHTFFSKQQTNDDMTDQSKKENADE